MRISRKRKMPRKHETQEEQKDPVICTVCSRIIFEGTMTIVYDKNRCPHPTHSMGDCEQKAREEFGVSIEISD